MLPPKDVPSDLEYNEYLKLFLQYQTLTWHGQIARTSKLMLDKAPPGGKKVPDEAKRKMAVLMTGLEGVIFVRNVQQEVSGHAKTLVNLTASKASSFIDKVEPMRKARTGIVSAFTLISDTIDETINKTLENHVLPAFGLPVDGIAEGLTAEEYLEMASKYERIGLPEPTREALELAQKSAKTAVIKQKVKYRLKTRVSSWRVGSKIHTKMLHAARNSLLQNEDLAKEIYEEILLEEPRFEWPYSYLSMIELTDGDLDRSKSLLNKAFKLNSNSLKGFAARLRMNLAEWEISDLEANCNRLDELEPGNEVTKAFVEIVELAKKTGLS